MDVLLGKVFFIKTKDKDLPRSWATV